MAVLRVAAVVFFTLLTLSAAVRPLSKRSPSLQHSFSQVPPVCSNVDISGLQFCNTSLPYDVRAKDLVDSMTLEEKAHQLGNKATGVPRLGIPPYQWWSEALHGVSTSGPGTFFNGTVPAATSFPTPLSLTASFNESLWRTLGQVTSTEARAMHNEGQAGLTFWSPNINVVRDPRWGRAMETPGEDTFVIGRYAVNYVRGLQDVEGHEYSGDLNYRPLKVSACCKHYAAYDLENWEGVDRFHFDAKVTAQDMIETFLPPFETCVKEGDVSSVMCSFNQINGIPICADTRLLSDTIKGDWNLHGYIVSDCDSAEVIHDAQKWLGDTQEETVARVLRAGMDLDCGDYYTNFTAPAVMEGKIRESYLDNALINLYVVLMRLGYFDGSPAYEKLGKDDVCTKDNIELATEAARQGMVLLKNDHNILPLSTEKYKKVAAVGPKANANYDMVGNYAGVPCNISSPWSAISKYAEVLYAMGCADVHCTNDTFIFPAVEASRNADATIILVGLDVSIENEALDRTDLLLPGYQTELINQVANEAPNPVILVVLCGGVVDISFAKDNPKINAIIWAGYPGEEGGTGIAEVIFGVYNPAGRLPLTWYKNDYIHQLPLTSMQMRPHYELGYPGRTYKFFNGSIVYPFGHGLSYTQFQTTLVHARRSVVTKLSPRQHCHNIPRQWDAYLNPCPAVLVDDLSNIKDETIDFQIQVKNVGHRDGHHVIIVYDVPPEEYMELPIKQVVAFKRVALKAGETQTVEFRLDVLKSLSVVSDTAYVVLPSGQHTIMVGDGDEAVNFTVNVRYI
ncbi:hypothetical protein AAC387_Pa02g4488 [Persea americana]